MPNSADGGAAHFTADGSDAVEINASEPTCDSISETNPKKTKSIQDKEFFDDIHGAIGSVDAVDADFINELAALIKAWPSIPVVMRRLVIALITQEADRNQHAP